MVLTTFDQTAEIDHGNRHHPESRRSGGRLRRRARHLRLLGVVVGLIVGLGALAPASAQTSDGSEERETPAPTAEEVAAAEEAKGGEVDAANAELGQVSNALAGLTVKVAEQATKAENASSELAAAQTRAIQAAEEVTVIEAEVADLESRLRDQAIRGFTNGVSDQGVAVLTGDPNETVRAQTMLAEVTQSDIDLVGTLAATREDLVVRRAESVEAVDAADQFRLAVEEQLAALQLDQQAQADLAAAAEQRLDHLLSERAALAALGAEIESSNGSEAALVDQLAAVPAPAPSGGSSNGTPVGRNQIRSVGKGISVHTSIADDVSRLLADASAAGLTLGGGGYRDSAAQITTRRRNCGTSNYAIYEMPASRCRPPTARPGTSMHEQGKAIDFTSNGQLIRSRSNKAYIWLNNNAVKYGLFNLPSEPWHWSVNGR